MPNAYICQVRCVALSIIEHRRKTYVDRLLCVSYMRPIATEMLEVARSVYLSVRFLVAIMSSAEADEPIAMPYWADSCWSKEPFSPS